MALNPKLKIYVDLDGVVADFIGGVCSLHNIAPETLTSKMRGSYDIASILGISSTQFWTHITESAQFWESLTLTPEARPLFEHLESKVPKSQIYFLSSPSLSPASYAGKAAWVSAHFPEYRTRLILTGHKHLLADQDSILIDDSDAKTHAFKSIARARAITFPRPWNSRHSLATDPLAYVFRELRL